VLQALFTVETLLKPRLLFTNLLVAYLEHGKLLKGFSLRRETSILLFEVFKLFKARLSGQLALLLAIDRLLLSLLPPSRSPSRLFFLFFDLNLLEALSPLADLLHDGDEALAIGRTLPPAVPLPVEESVRAAIQRVLNAKLPLERRLQVFLGGEGARLRTRLLFENRLSGVELPRGNRLWLLRQRGTRLRSLFLVLGCRDGKLHLLQRVRGHGEFLS